MARAYLIGGIVLVLAIAGAWSYRQYSHPLTDAGGQAGQIATSSIAGVPYPAGQGAMVYKSALFRFELSYPAELGQVSDSDDVTGAHLVVFDSGKDKSFQIYMTPYTKQAIDKEQFLTDEPSGFVDDPADVLIDGVRAIKFYGRADIGDTVNVWFINKGYLYEVATNKELEQWLVPIMQTWKFI